jgi:hypothetical protein
LIGVLLSILLGASGAQAARVGYVVGTVVEPRGLNEGDTVGTGTWVVTGADGLVVLEERWPSDIEGLPCMRLSTFGYGQRHRVTADATPGSCKTTTPRLDLLDSGRPFRSQETRYIGGKPDAIPPPQVRQSDERWAPFDRWIEQARHSYHGVVTAVDGGTIRLRSPSSGQSRAFAVDPATVQSALPLTQLPGTSVRIDYRRGGAMPERVERIVPTPP